MATASSTGQVVASEGLFLREQYELDETCAFCRSEGNQRKVLKCRHFACIQCAEEFLTCGNTIRCPVCQMTTPNPGPGKNLTQWLPSWPRKTSVGGGDEPEAAPKCQLHPSHELQYFCNDCKTTGCKLCVHRSHADHDVINFSLASDTSREQLSGKSSSGEAVETVIREVDQAIQETNEKATILSQQVMDNFSELRKILDEKEAEILREVDQRRWQSLKELEAEKDRHLATMRNEEVTKQMINQASPRSIVRFANQEEDDEDDGDEMSDEDSRCAHRKFCNIVFCPVTGEDLADIINRSMLTELELEAIDIGVKGFAVSQNRREASVHNIADDLWSAVRSTNNWKEQRIRFGVRFNSGSVFLGMASPVAMKPGCWVARHNKGAFLGWGSLKEHEAFTVGGQLGVNWKDGDIVELLLEGSKNRLTAHHKRSGAKETINLPNKKLGFVAELGLRSSITIIS